MRLRFDSLKNCFDSFIRIEKPTHATQPHIIYYDIPIHNTYIPFRLSAFLPAVHCTHVKKNIPI